jgi:hypothetical protein
MKQLSNFCAKTEKWQVLYYSLQVQQNVRIRGLRPLITKNCKRPVSILIQAGFFDKSISVDIFCAGFVDDTASYANKFLSDVPPLWQN